VDRPGDLVSAGDRNSGSVVAAAPLDLRTRLCGQPRDGNPAASYAMLDTDKGEITYFRVPYDVETAAAKIRRAGLPAMLAERLKWGQ